MLLQTLILTYIQCMPAGWNDNVIMQYVITGILR